MSHEDKMNSHTYQIESGPNRENLFDAFKYAYDENAHIPLNFQIALSYTQPRNRQNCAYVPAKVKDFRITSIQHEDGSGESFNLTGHCKANLRITLPEDGEIHYLSYRFRAYYNTRKREGSIVLTED